MVVPARLPRAIARLQRTPHTKSPRRCELARLAPPVRQANVNARAQEWIDRIEKPCAGPHLCIIMTTGPHGERPPTFEHTRPRPIPSTHAAPPRRSRRRFAHAAVSIEATVPTCRQSLLLTWRSLCSPVAAHRNAVIEFTKRAGCTNQRWPPTKASMMPPTQQCAASSLDQVRRIHVCRDGKDDVLGVYRYDTVRQIAAVVGCSPSHVSNVYHRLVTGHSGMEYVDVHKKRV